MSLSADTANQDQLPYLIVGQGIAGTLLAWSFEKANQPYFIIDNNHQTSASKIAAGIINPITGRRFVKSWMIDTFLPFAKTTYQNIEKELAIDVWQDLDIIRFFMSNAEGNNWLAKTTWEGYDKFLKKEKDADYLHEFINDESGYGTVVGAKVDLGKVIRNFQDYFKQKGLVEKEQFDYKQLKVNSESISYKKIKAKKVIFCEGFAAFKNPWFAHLPYESAKGEALILRIPQLKTADILKKHFFIVPLEDDLFWFGSNYEWDDLSNEPTETGRNFLEKELKEIIKVDYEIIDHLAAVRPVLKDRRPAIGLHPSNPNIGIFNGLGTKGTSIAPYWANELMLFLTEGKEIPKEIDVQRFKLPVQV